jgi:tripartite-type tricarboxylate transporter receptor subunit TctC
MFINRLIATVAAFWTLLPLTSAQAQSATALANGNYPSRPLKIVVPLSAGGPTDILMRIIAQPLSERLRQPVIIDNHPGAGGNIGADMVAKAAPDGYTFFMGTSGPLSINSTLYSKLSFDPMKDFAPVILIATAPFVVAANPSLPVKSFSDLIALAKQKPGKLNYGSVSGSASHLATELFKSMVGADIVFIPYKGAAPATTDLMSGQIDISFASTPGVLQHIKSGKLKALAVTSTKRLPQLPDVPTIAESGLAGYEAAVWYGLVAPANTPREIVMHLNTEIGKIIQERSTRERMINNDFEPIGSTPEQFGKFIQSETVKWGKVVKSSGAQAD